MTDILNVFEYNQHFVAMMNVINAARINPPEGGHKHHIVPRCWFKKYNLQIDNSKDNLVLLSEDDHLKVHKLAALCIKGADMHCKMAYSVHRLHGSFRGMHHTEETKKKISNNNARYWKGKVPPAAIANKGRKFTEEHRRKLSEAAKHRKGVLSHTNKGMTWKLIDGKRVYSGK